MAQWRREKRDPLLGTEASASTASSASGKHSAPAEFKERLGGLPGCKLDATNQTWLGREQVDHKGSVTSFPTFGVRRGSRKAGAEELDDEGAEPEEGAGPGLPGLLSPIHFVAGTAAEWIPSEYAVNPFLYLSGLFRGGVGTEKKVMN